MLPTDAASAGPTVPATPPGPPAGPGGAPAPRPELSAPAPGPPAAELEALVQELRQQQQALAQEVAQLRQAAGQEPFRQLFELNPDAMILVQGTTVVDCNPSALRLVGATDRRQLVGQPPWAFATARHPSGLSTADMFAVAVAEARRLGSRRGELTMHRASGELLWIESVITPLRVAGADLVHIVWRDVTADRRAAQQLRDSQDRLSLALEASATGVFTWDIDSGQVEWDAVAQAAFGHPYSPAPAAVQQLVERFHPADAARAAAAMQAVMRSSAPVELEYRVVWPDGSVHHHAAAGRRAADGHRFAGVVRDMTALRTAEEELNYKNQLVARMLDNMPMVLARLDARGNYLQTVGRGLEPIGLRPDTLLGQNALEAFPQVREPLQRLLAGEQVEYVVALDVNGQAVHFQNYGFFDAERQQATVLAIDVTEVERQKQQLRQEKELSESLLDNSVDGILAFDQEGRLLAWNQVMEQHTGRARAEVLGQQLSAAFPQWQTPAYAEAVRQVLAGQRLTRFDLSFHGRPGHYESYLVPLPGPENGAHGALVVIRDVTQRVEQAEQATRQQLRQQQEVLAAILATQEEERRRIAEGLHNGVGQLLYAAKLNLENRTDSVADLRRTAVSLLDDAIRATRTISFELTPGILEDFGLRIGLEELVKRIPHRSLAVRLNLVGLDQPRSRPLDMAIYRIVQELFSNILKHAQASEAFIHVVHEHQYVHISVEDNGIGFDADPDSSWRRGVGLLGIRNRVALLAGHLTLDSRPQRGTIVTIELAAK